MRNIVITILLTLLLGSISAEIGTFQQLGSGHFGGKLGTYASGDTLAMVFYDNPGTDPATSGWIVFRQSLDGGEVWTTQNVVLTDNCLTQPTLFYSPQEIIISYAQRTLRMMARSVDGGATWQTSAPDPNNPQIGRTFENSPYVERREGELKLFSLDLPYPEYAQDDYAHPERPEELIAPQLFTANEISTNDTPVYYWGPDVLNGVVRSNSDILIKQAGGGTNNGWPTFNAPVITSGEIVSLSGAYSEEQVFRGGLIEHAPPMEFSGNPRTYGHLVGPAFEDPNNIMYVRVDGGSYIAYLGQITEPVLEQADVYTGYPPSNANYLYTNNYPVRDTLWNFYSSGSCNNRANWVNGKLWLHGEFSSHQTWAASDTIFIVGEINLANTVPGASPENNQTDFVNLISEKSIVLKYGYVNPEDSLRYHSLCRADYDPIQIYANLYAQGNGNGNSRRDGVFTFEYQHPHPSVPPRVINGTLYDNIDLHRYRFPQTDAYPWASINTQYSQQQKIDYPWYNPLWPEKMPYLERGTIDLWGSVNQRRRGYLHRSYVDNEYPNPEGIWDQENDLCGSTSAPTAMNHTDPVLGIQLGTVNYPGATGSGVGYKRNYHYDARRSLSDSHITGEDEYSSVWAFGMGLYEQSTEGFERTYLKPQARRTHAKGFARKGVNALYSVNDLLLFAAGDVVSDWSANTVDMGMIHSLALDEDGSALLLQEHRVDNHPIMRIRSLSPGTGNVEYDFGMPVDTSISDATILPNGRKIIAWYDIETGLVYMNELFDGPVTAFLETWDLSVANPELYDLAHSRMYLVPASDNSLNVFLWLRALGADPNLPGVIFHARAEVIVPNDDPVIPPVPSVHLTAFPNPASQQMNIKIQTSSPQNHKLEIYNLRGQLVRSLDTTASSATGEFESSWNGRDNKGNRISSGIYFLRFYLDNKIVLNKRVCWM